MAERPIRKGEVAGSIPALGSTCGERAGTGGAPLRASFPAAGGHEAGAFVTGESLAREAVPMDETCWPPDHARSIEVAYASVDALVAHMGLVEVEVLVGEEPEEGVEFDVRGVKWDDSLERPDPLPKPISSWFICDCGEEDCKRMPMRTA